MFTPEDRLLFAFWKNLHNDLAGRGCTTDNLEPHLRRLPYSERVTIERKRLQEEAKNFLSTDDFSSWANISHLNAGELRGRFHAIHN